MGELMGGRPAVESKPPHRDVTPPPQNYFDAARYEQDDVRADHVGELMGGIPAVESKPPHRDVTPPPQNYFDAARYEHCLLSTLPSPRNT